MCTSKAEGGDRCKGTLTGKALYALYKERRSLEGSSKGLEVVQHRIDTLKALSAEYGACVAPHSINIEPNVEEVIDLISHHGKPFIVGGAVRDSFIGAENKDIDIEVHNIEIDKLVKVLRNKGYEVNAVGKQFGVLKVSKSGVVEDLDISVPRKENKTGAGHKDFTVEMGEKLTVEDASARRDFTFNAVLYDHKNKVIVDPYDGAKDFKAKSLRHVSEAFAEDPLRVLRAFQFAGRFDLNVDKDTAELCRSLKSEYSALSNERVVEEWEKFYSKSKHHTKGIAALKETTWDDTIPGLKNQLEQEKVVNSFENLHTHNSNDRVVLGASLIAKGMSKKDKKRFIESTVNTSKKQLLVNTISSFDASSVKNEYNAKKVARELAKTGFSFEMYEKYASLRGDVQGLDACKKAKNAGVYCEPEEPYVMGRDIQEMTTTKPGPWMGKVLAEMEDLQYQGKFKDKNEAISYVKSQLL